MLNSKQSRLLNKWKYATVLPILVLFMFAFQLEVRAQEKQKSQTESFPEADSIKAELLITKDSKKEELEREKDFFKKEFDVELKFSGIRYNANDELTSIKVKVKGNGVKREYSVKTDDPIVPFAIVVEQKNGKDPEISFSPQTFPNKAKGHIYIKSNGNDIVTTSDEEVIVITEETLNDAPHTEKTMRSITFSETVPTPPSPVSPPKVGFWSVNNVKVNDKDLLIVIDGEKQEKGETIQIPVNRSIDEIKTLDKKEGKKKYGSDGKKGAIEITTKEDTDPKTDIIIKSDLKTSKGKTITVIDEEDFEEGTYERTNNILIRTEQQLNDTEGLLLKYKDEEQEEVRKALQETRKEMEIARKEMRETRKALIEKRKAFQLERAKQIEERNKIKDERAKQREEWNKVKEEIKKAKEEN